MTTPTGRTINVPTPTTCAELYVGGAKVSVSNPIPVTGGTGGSGGGGAVTVANGADVAQGATTDVEATANGSVIAILKRIRTLLAGTLATSRTWTLASGTDSVNVGNLPATQAVTGAFWQTTQPVSVAATVTTADSRLPSALNADGGLPAHIQNFPATQPVSGTVSVSNFPATQPVSIASTVPVSGTFWQVTQPVSIAATVTTADSRLPSALNADGGLPIHVQNFPVTQPVSIASMPNTPVTGTFFQATQPVSAAALPLPAGAAQDGTDISSPTAMPAGGAGIRGWLSAIWTKLNGSLAVTGTFWQATQPVSLATAPTTPVTGTFWQATQPVSLATNTPVIATGTNSIGTVQQAALTKGTQGATGVSTQDLKDAGRTAVVLSATAVTSIITETVVSLNQYRAAAASTVTSYTVPAGKTFRLQTVQFGVRAVTPSTTVTFGSARFNLRAGALVSSPLIYGDSKQMQTNTATPNSDLPVPDGLEFPAGTVLSLWQTCSAVTMALDALIVGYEY